MFTFNSQKRLAERLQEARDLLAIRNEALEKTRKQRTALNDVEKKKESPEKPRMPQESTIAVTAQVGAEGEDLQKTSSRDERTATIVQTTEGALIRIYPLPSAAIPGEEAPGQTHSHEEVRKCSEREGKKPAVKRTSTMGQTAKEGEEFLQREIKRTKQEEEGAGEGEEAETTGFNRVRDLSCLCPGDHLTYKLSNDYFLSALVAEVHPQKEEVVLFNYNRGNGAEKKSLAFSEIKDAGGVHWYDEDCQSPSEAVERAERLLRGEVKQSFSNSLYFVMWAKTGKTQEEWTQTRKCSESEGKKPALKRTSTTAQTAKEGKECLQRETKRAKQEGEEEEEGAGEGEEAAATDGED